MRMLFVSGGSPATVFALAPLAAAARNAGHTVMMAATDDMMSNVAGVGLPAVPFTDRSIWYFISTDREGRPVRIPDDPLAQARFTGEWFARMAVAGMPALRQLAEDWRPDLVVGGSLSYAAGLLARELDLPYVRHAWDAIETTDIDPGAEQELRPELAELGLDGLPAPDLFIDVCPPSLRPPRAEPAQFMRWAPGNRQRKLERWMYTRGERPRVLVTSGSRLAPAAGHEHLRSLYALLFDLVAIVAPLDVELLVAAPEAVAAEVNAERPDLRAGWIPMDVVAPTCDLIVHHGGGVTSLTALHAGVPQMVIPQGHVLVPAASRISDFGAGVTVLPGEDVATVVPPAVEKVVSDRSYAERARVVADEMTTLPLPSEVVDVLARLAKG
ncbi:nucleotide disphospho-sugar-binding domain-containing protein [Nocardia noduli]|uniref:nucleotide disphospho-sugar-binding domain-containing protein n=1 Tax=Nocardia noduli TaxID=2815722 RepID=UPI001C238C77|nr:nucleotide disphospho-sugar-binding domain-containing protein [Nocardia noduli]